MRDQKPWVGASPSTAVYRLAPDWKEEHVICQLSKTRGLLQSDGYKGFAKLYASGADGGSKLQEASCWAHPRRDFHEVWSSTKSKIEREALDRIGSLYDIERQINVSPADDRHAMRQARSESKVAAFFTWSEQQLLFILGKSDMAKAFRYAFILKEAFSLLLPTVASQSRTTPPSGPGAIIASEEKNGLLLASTPVPKRWCAR